MKKNKGITLIALVITIIVLLILAGVVIATLTGENGLITKADEARKTTDEAGAKEAIQMAIAGCFDENGKYDPNQAEKALQDLAGKDNVKRNGDIITVTYKDKAFIIDQDGKIDKIYPPFVAANPNPPVLKDGMELVKYDEGKKDFVVDSTNSEYSYVKGTGNEDNNKSKWANGRLNGNYYVWIPRYAYKIDNNVTYASQAGRSHKIDVKFVDTNTKGTDREGYLVHPAFTFGTEELPGIWVGKYETSGTVDKPTIIPNVTSLRSINVKSMFNTAQKLKTTNYDAHMMKNMEWGAVVYLAQSPYGRNGTEISVNECTDFITGAGKATGTNKISNSTYTQTDMIEAQKYNGEIGKLSSTTGNVYGVYDISGGAWDTVMGILGTGNPIKPILGETGFSETEFSAINSKYYDIYTNPTNSKSDATGGKIGDATKETKGWNSDYANFPYSSNPVFYRGGYYGYGGGAGAYHYACNTGWASYYYSFRVVL